MEENEKNIEIEKIEDEAMTEEESQADVETKAEKEANDEEVDTEEEIKVEEAKAEDVEKSAKKSRRPSKGAIKGFFVGVGVTLAAVIVILALYINIPIGYSVTSPESLSAAKKTNELLNIIDKYYMGDIDEQLISDYMYLGIVSGLEDPYSTYYTQEEYEKLSVSQQGHYKGIGVSVVDNDGEITIAEVEEDGPAENAGIQADDVIKSVNGEEVSNHTLDEVIEMIRDASSDDIALGIYRPSTDENLDITVTRELMDSVSVAGGMVDDTGYIAIQSFTGVTAEQFAEILEQIKENGAVRLVIDLRGNGGGLVSAACDTLRELIPDGVLVYTEDKYGNRNEIISESGKEAGIPIAVLVDEDTASASEIFAGAMQDYQKAVIVGKQTYGKGIIQDVYQLGDGSVVRLTVEHYYTPNGNDIHEIGITPDVDVEYDTDSETDTQFEAALEALINPQT